MTDGAARSNKCRFVKLPKTDDRRGSLVSVESGDVPFKINRVFCIFSVPDGVTRGGHALKSCEELIVAICGEFDVISDDGTAKTRRRMISADCGLYVPRLTWLELENFTPGAVCLVFASEPYSESSHFHTYAEFKAAAVARSR